MKYVRRLLWFIASRLVIVSAIFVAVVMVFYISMNAANIYILLDEGMSVRTETILTRENPEDLNSYFRANFLRNDAALNLGLSAESPYQNYKIDGFEDTLQLEWVWSWPWENTAQATIVYRVPIINGSALSSKQDLVENGLITQEPPAWQGGRYRMTLTREQGQWKIAGMTQTQILIDPTVAPTASPQPEG